MKTCSNCKENKNLDLFGKKTNAKDGKQSRCLTCQREKVKEHYNNNKTYYKEKAKRRNSNHTKNVREYLLSVLLENPCVDCGEADIRCLQFDHVRGNKVTEISNMVRRFFPLEVIKLEIEKCEVRCANCHLKRTAEQFGWWTHALVYPLATDELKG
ncbi:MAG: hypothetical protein E6R04_00255 [Spirochaetes bacterium]|nr:MAG: hypothetical protein E6R04_00255 [Spirochaetota bacterium]